MYVVAPKVGVLIFSGHAKDTLPECGKNLALFGS